jgi:DNA polymerase-3 subunit alpha
MSVVKNLGMDSVAITDHGNMYGVIEFYKAAKEAGIKPIIGCEFYITNDITKRSIKDDNQIYHLTLLAMDDIGYHNLIKLVSEANLKGFYYKPRIDFELLRKYSDGLICLSGCLGGQISTALLKEKYDIAEFWVNAYRELFGNRFYIEIMRHPNNKDQSIVTPRIIDMARRLKIPMVATSDSHYLHKEDSEIHEVFLAVNTQKSLHDKDRLSLKDSDIFLASPAEMIEKFRDIPEAISNTQEIVKRCNVEIILDETKLPRFDIPKGETYDTYLKHLCKKSPRYDVNNLDRLGYELNVIKATGFASYLLIVWDIIKWAKDNGISVGPGRGSAAGSLICYYLGITDIDPLRYGLLFERFMNPDRISMPDIDMDFDDTKRNLVVKYVTDKYGQDYVSQIITFGSMFARSAIRDAGRAMSYDLKTCDRIAKMIPFNSSLTNALKNVKELRQEYQDEKSKKLIDTAIKLEGTVRNAGTHACGIVISDKPITEYMPVQRSKEGLVTAQYDMKCIESLGLLKMDFLGLRNLSVISECQKLIKEQLGEDVNVDDISLDDAITFKLLSMGKTTSVFQLESPGMKRYVKELKPTSIDDLAVLVSLYRPGPMNLIPEYISRKHGLSPITYLHPNLEPILKDTYGIMIYQEQLISAVQALAGMSLSQADVLRKAVGKKDAKLLHQQEDKFKSGCKQNKVDAATANQFWNLIEPFIGYGFNKSHAVCYALIGYQTAYLKANYPLQFMIAEMNSDTSIERITELVAELSDMGINLKLPNINLSSNKFINNKNEILFSFQAIKGMGEKISELIIQERTKPFKSIEDFIFRMNGSITKKHIELLSKSGTFDTFTNTWANRNSLFESAEQLSEFSKFEYKELLPSLFLSPSITTWGQTMSWEKELLGLYITCNPASNYSVELKNFGTVDIANLPNIKDSNLKIGGVITDIKKKVLKSGRTIYNLNLLDMTSTLPITIFEGTYSKYKDILKQNNVVVFSGNYSHDRERSQFRCYSCTFISSFQ